MKRYWRPFTAALLVILGSVAGSSWIHENLHGALLLLTSTALHVVLLGVGIFFALPQFVQVYPQLQLVWSHASDLEKKAGNHKARGAMLGFLGSRLDAHFKGVDAIFEGGLEIPDTELGYLTDAAFRGFRGRYVGTDSNPPSQFRILYPDYLAQEARHRKPWDIQEDTRYLISTQADLLEDYRNERREFTLFCDWHQANGIALLQVEPDVAELEQKNLSLPSCDIGLYGDDYVMFFERSPTGVHRIRLNPLSADLRHRVGVFFDRLTQRASRIYIGNEQLLSVEPLTATEVANQHARLGLR